MSTSNRMNWHVAGLVIGLLFASSSWALEKSISAEKLDAVEAAIRTQVDAGQLSGATLMIAQHGEVKKFVAMGYQDVENNVTMAKDTIFRIYSMTKPVAGAALMMLYDEGRFKLSDPVEKYIPEFTNLQVAKADGPDGVPITEPADHKMTIRELMSHSGGLTYGFFSQSQVDSMYVKAGVLDPNSTLKQMVQKLGKIPLWAQPGTTWHYSVAVDVQGYLVEALTGIPFDIFLQQRLFNPLGMKDTDFYVPAKKAARLARYYDNSSGQLVSEPNAQYLKKPVFLSGGGGLASTAQDYMRFAQMHLNGGEYNGVRLLTENAVKQMRSNQLPDNVKGLGGFLDPGNTFGLDFAVVNDSAAAFGQPQGVYWWFGIAGSWFWIDPVNELVVIGMIQTKNVMQSIGLHRQVKRIIYAN